MKPDVTKQGGVTELTFAEILAHVRERDATRGDEQVMKVAFLRNATLDPMPTYLKYYGYEARLRIEIYEGGFDQALQEAIDAGSGLYAHQPNLVAVALHAHGLLDRLIDAANRLSVPEVEAEKRVVRDMLERLISLIRSRSQAVIVVHNFEVPVQPTQGVRGLQDAHGVVNSVRRLNLELVDVGQRHKGVYIVDVDLVQSRLGRDAMWDARQWHIGRMPYSRAAARTIAGEYIKYIRALCGRGRKCLVLDCDNTLWGGIVGEDGPTGIRLGTSFPGSAYLELQKVALELHANGVLLAICSRNNEKDVLEVLERHPDMLLRRHHLAIMRVNWDDKVANLRAIARELNLGLDSLLFVDDSPFEIGMVRDLLPEVLALQLPPDPVRYAEVLAGCGAFDALSISEEDRRRTELYAAEQQRREVMSRFDGHEMEHFRRFLEMELELATVEEITVSRVAQLSQRTNQFNLTTRRYSDAEIAALAADDGCAVRHVRLRDRFGDMGLVGCAIARFRGDTAEIESLFLSCRALGRTVEDILLHDIENIAAARGCLDIEGVYLPTEKNAQVSDFYLRQGFGDAGAEGEGRRYRRKIRTELPACMGSFKSVKR